MRGCEGEGGGADLGDCGGGGGSGHGDGCGSHGCSGDGDPVVGERVGVGMGREERTAELRI